MSTTKELSLCKGLPYQIRARANGKFDYVADNMSYSQDTSVSLSMTTYNGLSEQYTQGYQTADITDFGLTALPWGYEYNQSLSTSRFCLMPIKHDYLNVTPKVATQDYSVSGSVTFDSTTGYVTITGDNYIYKKVTSHFTAPSTSVEVQLKLRPTQFDVDQPSSTECKFFSDTSGGVGDSNSRLRIRTVYNGLMVNTFGISYGGLVVSGSDWAYGTWYWVKVVITASSCIAYWSLDGENWSSGFSINGVPVLSDIADKSQWMLGRMNLNSATVYDLNHCHIIADGSTYWWKPLGEGAGTAETLPGVTYNYVDDGSAVTLNCFTENFDDAVVLTPNVSYASHEMVNPWSGKIYPNGTYTSIATTDDWEDTDNVIDWEMSENLDSSMIGNPEIDTYFVYGFSTSDYLMQNKPFDPGNHYWTLHMDGTRITQLNTRQILAQSDGFTLGVDENNHFFADFYDANGKICNLTVTDYDATVGTNMDATISYDVVVGEWQYLLIVGTTFQDHSYALQPSNRTILSGPITFGCGYNPIPQRLLGTVSIPAHTVYDYDNGTWTEESQGGSEGIEVPEFDE